jgi:NAD(P)-dependent dehydrogenase (short-subunit alcohol dehydrogenase family)
MKEFTGKVAVVTGAASGIGFALAKECAQRGMKLVLADIESQALEKAKAELAPLCADILTVVTDVSDASSMDALAEQTLKQ